MIPSISSRALTYWIVGIGLFISALLGHNLEWRGSSQLHTIMEVIATLLAVIVGAMALVRYYSKENTVFLFVGVGFLGTAFLDGYHAVVTSAYFRPFMPSDLPHLIPWSWVASRQFLAVLMFLSWVAWRREERLGVAGQIPRRVVYIGTAVFTLTSFIFFTFAPLPRAYYPEIFFHRPEEFAPAIFYMLALFGYLTKGRWRDDHFEHWLVLSLIVAFTSQAVFMSQSGVLFDYEFDAAHTLKKVSYICVLAGLLISMFVVFRREIEVSQNLLASELRLQEYSRNLESEVGKRTEELQESEANLRKLLDSAPTGIGVVDQETNERLFVNQRLVEMMGGTSADQLTTASLADSYVNPDDVQELRRTLVAGGIVENVEIHRRRIDGSTFWSLQSSQALGTFHGKDARVVWMVDVSALKDTERELEHAYAQISSSIDYASNIQKSLLPTEETLQGAIGNHFVAWEPKDVVGGDFYWIREWAGGRLLILGDCTGHGVPGAFMTLIATATLNRSLRETPSGQLDELMSCINGRIKTVLGQDSDDATSDDGMDVGMVYFKNDSDTAWFCGAGVSLFATGAEDIAEFKGARFGVGFNTISTDQEYPVVEITTTDFDAFYLASDGVFDQTGGDRGHGYGKRRFKEAVVAAAGQEYLQQRASLLGSIEDYQGDHPRRDDLTIIGFETGGAEN